MASLTADFARAAALAEVLGAPRVLESRPSELSVLGGTFAMRLDITGIDPATLQDAVRHAGFPPGSPVQYALSFATEAPVTIVSPEPITLDEWALPRPFGRADLGLRWISHEKQRRVIEDYGGIVRAVYLDIIYPPAGMIYGPGGELVETSKSKAAKKRRKWRRAEQIKRLKEERSRVEQEEKDRRKAVLSSAGITMELPEAWALYQKATTPEEKQRAEQAIASLVARERDVVTVFELEERRKAEETARKSQVVVAAMAKQRAEEKARKDAAKKRRAAPTPPPATLPKGTKIGKGALDWSQWAAKLKREKPAAKGKPAAKKAVAVKRPMTWDEVAAKFKREKERKR